MSYMRIDGIIVELCTEIDTLTEECAYWKTEYEKIKVKYDKSIMTSINQSHAMGLGMLAIATKDEELAKSISKWNSD